MATRREILAAAIAAPILAAPTVVSAAPTLACFPISVSPQWLDACKAMDIAQSAHDVFYRATFEPTWEAANATAKRTGERLGHLIPTYIRDEDKRLEDAAYAAFREVSDFAAATPADLVAKIEFLKDRDIDIDHDRLLADLRRVFGES